jgi:hypothetical protein
MSQVISVFAFHGLVLFGQLMEIMSVAKIRISQPILDSILLAMDVYEMQTDTIVSQGESMT